eukprot:TRINITY_DN80195_c0_g1_i1.p1 TRINITY_DN80195_c0_g1~~TRINITY_DN80195_c0_g1_i1.p1  ORF type:complete len:148 (+),score=15.87 TRINITY_DN80195_c0_g1_i1:68-445(+)
MQRDPIKANMRRRFLSGMREVGRAVRLGRAKCVLVAPNIEQVEAKGGLDDAVAAILSDAAATSTPVVFALTRRRLSAALKQTRCRMSAVAILDYDGANEVFKRLMREAEAGRQLWMDKMLAVVDG